MTGVFLKANLRLEVLVDSKGFGVDLTPGEARSLAGALLERAHAIEQRAGTPTEAAKDGGRLLASPN